MLTDFAGADRVYIACGYTDLRCGIDGLASIVQQQFNLDPFTNTLFLFCGRRRDRIKALYWEGNGFVLLYMLSVKLSNVGIFRLFTGKSSQSMWRNGCMQHYLRLQSRIIYGSSGVYQTPPKFNEGFSLNPSLYFIRPVKKI